MDCKGLLNAVLIFGLRTSIVHAQVPLYSITQVAKLTVGGGGIGVGAEAAPPRATLTMSTKVTLADGRLLVASDLENSFKSTTLFPMFDGAPVGHVEIDLLGSNPPPVKVVSGGGWSSGHQEFTIRLRTDEEERIIEILIIQSAEDPPPRIGAAGPGQIEAQNSGVHPFRPAMPWPPPAASAEEVLPPAVFHCRRLNEGDQLLTEALRSNGYNERSYYAVPGGFALVTRLEQIDRDGRWKPLPDRWLQREVPLRVFSPRAYLTRLLTANEGYFRVIVFAVTDQPFSQQVESADPDDVNAWLRSGLNVLPPTVGTKMCGTGTKATALIYEFATKSKSPAHSVIPGYLDAQTHLTKSGILSALAANK